MKHVNLISAGFSPFFDDCSQDNIEDITVHQHEIITSHCAHVDVETERLLMRLDALISTEELEFLSGFSEATAGGEIPTNDSRDMINKYANSATAKNASHV